MEIIAKTGPLEKEEEIMIIENDITRFFIVKSILHDVLAGKTNLTLKEKI